VSVVVGAEGLTKRFRRGREVVTAVEHATFELASGVLTALVGPSGSGKTTLLNLLVRGDDPDEGRVVGVPDRPDWSQLALVPQALGLLPELTVGENVDLPRRLGAVDTRPARDVMDRLGVAELFDRAPGEVSLGEQQRTAVARALVTAPALVVADEPTSHQDDANARRVIAALVDSAGAGSCVLVATHDRRVLEVCGRVLRMRDGVVSDD
jgi:putative ABC transport system ATP-binding protein